MRGKIKIATERIVHVGIDLLGSDIPPKILLQAVLAFKSELKPTVQLTLFGTKELFVQVKAWPEGILLHGAPQTILMEDDPLRAIRSKKQSSLYLGVQMLQQKHLDAFISCGNTGALMAASKLLLSTLPGIKRPALLTLLPTQKTEVAVLDVGANTSYKAEQLVQFALMGVAFQKSRGITLPKVALLNIGSEAKKGTPELRRAYESLQEKSKRGRFVFIGNCEARAVFHGGIDVLVTDGFTGNIFLKTAEGIGLVVFEEIERATKQVHDPSIRGTLAKLRHHLHYAEYPGALLAGVNGIVIKCHGAAASTSVLSSINSAVRLLQHRFLQSVSQLKF